ncbi:CRISPR-associated protein [Corynebacterium ulcerans]|uniref:CRISPR-associated endonuclease Cas2 n=1 Tax=Corynebacterium ulcerans TaxID=65058 RepID=UPI000C7FCA19|nr:CRISPR-associated endonuclease Cas2 [Corynebacterium ulcerans]PME07035.1 CRISPR-associated protein [Corynebacterium ulcerans]
MRRDDVRRTIIAYDIAHDRRRNKLVKILQKYGDRIQYSVFVVDCSPAKLLRLKDEIKLIISAEEDSVLYCDLGLLSKVDTTFTYEGRKQEITDNEFLII